MNGSTLRRPARRGVRGALLIVAGLALAATLVACGDSPGRGGAIALSVESPDRCDPLARDGDVERLADLVRTRVLRGADSPKA